VTEHTGRLESWKEIAAYLRRDVTTVRRWEKREGLPVHRHLHDKLGTVYAYRAEVDAWWQGRVSQLDEDVAATESRGPTWTGEHRAWAVAAVFCVAAVVATAGLLITSSRIPGGTKELRFSISPPDDTTFGTFAVSPDGGHLAFTAVSVDGTRRLWVRPLDSVMPVPLVGTDDAAFPFWSPDGRSIGFFARGKLKRIAVSGGTAEVLCDAPDGRGGSWNSSDVILFAPDRSEGLHRIAATGGVPKAVTTVDEAYHQGHLWPEFLPDGRHFIYYADATETDQHGIYIGALDGTRSQRLLTARSNAEYARGGYLLFARDGALVAQRFDVNRLVLAGEPIVIADEVLQQYGLDHKGDFSASIGVLAYRRRGSHLTRLAWVNRRGERVGTLDEPAIHADPAMSPDGKRLAFDVFDPASRAWISDIWLLDLSTGAKTRFTFDKAADFEPVWSPDGTRIVFASDRSGTLDLYEKSSTGSGEDALLATSGGPKHADAWSPDGRFLVYSDVHPKTRYDIWILPLVGDRKPVAYLRSEFDEGQSQVSPNGRWLAYTSNESGRMEVYVRSFPVPEGKWQVSSSGGADPRWRRDGNELFYIAADGKLMALPVETGSVFEAGRPRPLFDTAVKDLWEDARNHYEVTPDGDRFLVVRPMEHVGSLPFTVVVNWTAALPR